MDAPTRVAVAVRDAVADLGPGDLVLVACSGGADSLALAAAAASLAPAHPWTAGAVVVDHGWSRAAGRAGRRAADLLKELGLDPVERLAVPPRTPRTEAAARQARYDLLDDAARRLGAAAVLLGHTLDDQAETVLLGLGRGSGARSLAGMPVRRGPYRRPLLGLRRSDTTAACAARGLRPWADPANADPRHARVRVRALGAALQDALGPGAIEALARSADLLRDDADALEALADGVLDRSRRSQGPVVTLAPGPLRAVPVAVRRRALLAAAREAGCPPGALSARHAAALDALLDARPGAELALPGRVVARRAESGVGLGPADRPSG